MKLWNKNLNATTLSKSSHLARLPPPFAATENNGKALTTSPAILQKLGLGETSHSFEADLPLPLAVIREISQCQYILQYYLAFLHRYCRQPKSQSKSPNQEQTHHDNDDHDYGSALEHDVIALQAISRRVHYGAIYVAESKFRSQEKQLRPLIEQWQKSCNAEQSNPEQLNANQSEAATYQERILSLITRPEVEQKILQRVYDKAFAIQLGSQEKVDTSNNIALHRFYLEPAALRDFYENAVIPLTKQGELAYLYRRV